MRRLPSPEPIDAHVTQNGERIEIALRFADAASADQFAGDAAFIDFSSRTMRFSFGQSIGFTWRTRPGEPST